ncbi:MAG: PKD domain-containing protein [Rhodothermales bacterium]
MKHLYKVLAVLLFAVMLVPDAAFAQEKQVVQSSRHNTSTALRSMQPVPRQQNVQLTRRSVPNKRLAFGKHSSAANADKLNFTDPVHQSIMGTLAPSVGANFEGSSDADNSAILGFAVVPPDTDGDVGPNHYVQWINSVSEIFDKNGNTLVGPFAGNQYFQGLGGDCESDNSGDPITLYDEAADRWLVSQFAVAASPYFMCVAISQTADPTGAYHQYAFDFGTDFPDYPKLGIWGDSYIMTTRDFANGAAFAGISAVAMDRTAMLNGTATTMVRFPNAFSSISDGPLPADHDGGASMGSGPALFGAHGDDNDTEFELWELDVDWNNPNAATFSSISGVTVSAYDNVVPSANQPNGQVLDDHSFFTMARLNVRDFGTHQSMVANHTVETTTGTAGIRWYEFRNTGSGWTLHQEGTYSPDTDDRWMGSISINANGDIGLGYSRSSSSLHPSIYFTGQTADQSGTGIMNVAETLIHAGTGSQSGASRWGDYSKIAVDPVDGQTFWYTTEYYETTSSFNFKTRIASFLLDDNVGGNNPPVASFSSSCTLLDCDFTDASVDSDGTVTDWAWDFGDGNSSTSQNPSHTYAANGTYSVMLTVTDDMGATGSISSDVTVDDGISNNPPTASFSSSCTLLSCDFTDGSSDSDGSVVSWAWDFGDGNSSTSQNPSNAYAADGTYTVMLTVTDDMGATGSTSASVTVDDGVSGGPALSVSSLRLGKVRAGGSSRQGKATISVVDDNGAKVADALVTGTFSGPIDETASDATNGQGRAVIISAATFPNKEFQNLDFCIENITLAGFTYDPNGNADPSWDCGSSAAGVAGGGRSFDQIGSQGIPETFMIEQNYPNPFNPTTLINFGMPESAHVSVRVYNLLGQEVATLVNEVRDAGVHTVNFDAGELSAGVYLYVMQTADFSVTKRMTLLK